jgi:small-conductance mechanosensitive channel
MFDGTYVRLPNSDVFLSEIRNYSGAIARRVEFTIGVSYDSDTQKVMQVIRQTLKDTPLVLVEPEPDVYVHELADSAVNISVWCWVPFSLWFDMKKQLVEQVMNALSAAGIEIPFPQRVIYLKKAGRKKKPGAPGTAAPPGPGAGSSLGVNIEEMMDD